MGPSWNVIYIEFRTSAHWSSRGFLKYFCFEGRRLLKAVSSVHFMLYSHRAQYSILSIYSRPSTAHFFISFSLVLVFTNMLLYILLGEHYSARKVVSWYIQANILLHLMILYHTVNPILLQSLKLHNPRPEFWLLFSSYKNRCFLASQPLVSWNRSWCCYAVHDKSACHKCCHSEVNECVFGPLILISNFHW